MRRLQASVDTLSGYCAPAIAVDSGERPRNARCASTAPVIRSAGLPTNEMQDPENIPGDWTEPSEALLRGIFDRILQLLARIAPGARTLRVLLHRARGVRIGKGVWIGYDVLLDTARPDLIVIEDGVSISMRASIIAHFKEFRGVRIEREAFIGPGAIILPNVVVGHGAVVKAGSVVSQSVPPMTVVEGNPARAVARCGVALRQDISMKAFSRRLQPLASSLVRSPDPETEQQVDTANR